MVFDRAVIFEKASEFFLQVKLRIVNLVVRKVYYLFEELFFVGLDKRYFYRFRLALKDKVFHHVVFDSIALLFLKKALEFRSIAVRQLLPNEFFLSEGVLESG